MERRPGQADGGRGRRAARPRPDGAVARLLAAMAVMQALLWAPPGLAADYGGFFEYTLYTRDEEPAEQFRPNVIVMFHGFKSVMPNNDYDAFYKAFAGGHTVAGFNYHYVDVETNVAELRDLHDRYLKERNLIVVGTSLGGFWADYFANRVGASGVVLVNPVTDPAGRARKNLGEHYSKKRQQSFTVTEETARAYERVTPAENPRTRRLVLLTRDDEVIPHEAALAKFGKSENSRVVVFENGGHKLDLKRPDVMAVIRDFIEARSVK